MAFILKISLLFSILIIAALAANIKDPKLKLKVPGTTTNILDPELKLKAEERKNEEIKFEGKAGKLISLTADKGHFSSNHSALTNRPDAKTQLSLIFLRVSSCFFGCFV